MGILDMFTNQEQRKRETHKEEITQFITNNRGVLIGSKALGVDNASSDFDYLIPLDNIMQIRYALIDEYDFVETPCTCDEYGTLIRLTNGELKIDAFALTEESHEIYLKTHEIMTKLPIQWVQNKVNRVVLTNAIQTALGRSMSLPVTFSPTGYDLEMKPKDLFDAKTNS